MSASMRSRFWWPSSQARASPRPGDPEKPRLQRAARLYEAARRGRGWVRACSARGTRVGATRSSTTERSMTHWPMSLRLGRSYMTSSSTSSRMARSPRAPVPRSRACSATAPEGVLAEDQLHVVQLEHPAVLLDQGVLGLDQDPDQGRPVQVGDRPDHRQPADELGDQPELEQVLGQHLGQQVALAPVLGPADVGPEADALPAQAAVDDPVQAGEGPAADEQDVGGVDLDELLVGVLAPALGRDRGGGPFQDLEQRLLHALARHVPGDRRVLALAGDLVDLVDVDDARSRPS